MESSDEFAAAIRSSSTTLRINALRGLHDKVKSQGKPHDPQNDH